MKKQKKVEIKFDFGCGQNKQPGFIGVDIAKTKGVDIVCDLKKFPWKFAKKESATEVFASHFVEHLTGAERMKFMEEVYRILVPGGKATFITPYYNSIRASQDPTHEWPPVSEATYLYFNKSWREQNKLDHYPIKCDFDFTYGYFFAPEWLSKSQETRDFAAKHYTNAINDLQVNLIKR
jgi:SAM-dependent methyltransferase